MHVAKRTRKLTACCKVCHGVKPEEDFIAKHSGKYRICKECKGHLNRLNRFGVTPKDYATLLQKQEYKCGICREDLILEGNNAVVDHCHGSNEVRGILCRGCNNGLGNFRDKNNLLAEAAKYLIFPPARGVVNQIEVTQKYKFLRECLEEMKCDTSSSK